MRREGKRTQGMRTHSDFYKTTNVASINEEELEAESSKLHSEIEGEQHRFKSPAEFSHYR